MINKVIKFVGNPKKYFRRGAQQAQQRLCWIFKDSSFFMQLQMDISPKSLWHRRDFAAATGGFFPTMMDSSIDREIVPLEPWDNTRRDMLVLLLRTVVVEKIEGDIAELGVYRGNTAKLFHYYLPERELHLFDTFQGFTNRGSTAELTATGDTVNALHFADTSIEAVKDYICQKNNRIHFYSGYFPETVPENLNLRRFAFVHLDADLYQPTLDGLRYFYPRMSNNGMIVVHDYNAWPGARQAVEHFLQDKAEIAIPMPDKSGSALIVRSIT
ncbi:TylF/MycF/NovP-related O-methyltransferase [uncultured Thiodictyon sp.]|uniref:TylF/MycF/NovP-related O-methyltransferase n=1 Tax=uncultured Thiodictyon sp. TaxID=1846217 RepID=UPI0025D9067E|nr:TylF/MycF/NovP-related O-methyltransferase [uncultured Thiodictyon sp.]